MGSISRSRAVLCMANYKGNYIIKHTKMKASLRKLNLLFRLTKLRPDMFYDICVESGNRIKLQGKYNPDLALYLRAKKLTYDINANGYTVFVRGNIRIVLT